MITEEKKIVSWHLFYDYCDEWYETRKQAEEVYRQLVNYDKNINIRLYKTWSYENDIECEEDYIKGRGNFPW